jgi:two-component system cell cycle sensor histidine kinase/response regulator CckA
VIANGSIFTDKLSRAAGVPIPDPPEPPRERIQPAAGTILLVEDEAPVRAIARRILARDGYTVIEASNGREALRCAERHAGEIDMVVTDMVMPEMGGRAFAEAFSVLHPSTPVLFVSGYPDDDILRRGALAPGMAFLEKPFTPHGLLEAVRGMFVAAESRDGARAASGIVAE